MKKNNTVKGGLSRYVGVLTGDISGSQSYSDGEISNILAALKQYLTNYATRYDGHFDIYRGDAFQLAVEQPQYSMHIALGLRLALKAHSLNVDVKISVAVGEAYFRPKEVKTGTGEAFVLSGRGLDTIKPYHLAFFSSDEQLESNVQLLTRFADAHISALTQTQSETLLAYLEASDKSHENIAAILDKNRSNVSRILNASNYKLVAEYLTYMAQAIATKQEETE
ncbi:hypothetical protein E5672_05865 [Alteromonas portus]|uniref:Uncharacterized protein n=1 Tax=Alteromonas portus TaxID=2565549 RepID=A0A4U0ZJF2_9ALTE|nr:hypothetical protein [Alteromonas portus]TKB04325.1 hypothetical protein E5672_05865 [Alteromonas portus]